MKSVLGQAGRALRETGQAIDRLGSVLQGSYAFKEALSRHRRVMPFGEARPSVAEDAFVAPNASVIGNVSLGQRAVVWYGAVLRGDRSAIAVGAESSIGDRVVVHGSVDRSVQVGQRVTVGQAAVLHGCSVGDGSVIGPSALVFGTVGKNAQVGAGAMVLEHQTVPDGQLWDGRPAKFVRALSDEEKSVHATQAGHNVELAAKHRDEHARSEAERQTRRDFVEFDRNSPATTLHEHPF